MNLPLFQEKNILTKPIKILPVFSLCQIFSVSFSYSVACTPSKCIKDWIKKGDRGTIFNLRLKNSFSLFSYCFNVFVRIFPTSNINLVAGYSSSV